MEAKSKSQVHIMVLEHFTPLPSFAGGLLIGTAAAGALLLLGRIAGVSGISKALVEPDTPSQEKPWRLMFLLGLVLGGGLITWIQPQATAFQQALPPLQMAGGGLLVGIGTAMANGCTSGHGVCGLGRRSRRSLAAVLTFMGAGFVTMWLMTQALQLGRIG